MTKPASLSNTPPSATTLFSPSIPQSCAIWLCVILCECLGCAVWRLAGESVISCLFIQVCFSVKCVFMSNPKKWNIRSWGFSFPPEPLLFNMYTQVVVKNFHVKPVAKWRISWRCSLQQWRFDSQRDFLSWKYMQSCYSKVLWIKVFPNKCDILFVVCSLKACACGLTVSLSHYSTFNLSFDRHNC